MAGRPENIAVRGLQEWIRSRLQYAVDPAHRRAGKLVKEFYEEWRAAIISHGGPVYSLGTLRNAVSANAISREAYLALTKMYPTFDFSQLLDKPGASFAAERRIHLDRIADLLKIGDLEEHRVGSCRVTDLAWHRPRIVLRPASFMFADRSENCTDTIAWRTGESVSVSTELYAAWKTAFNFNDYVNDPVGMLESSVQSLCDTFSVRVCDFATVSGLQTSRYQKPVGLTGDVVAVADDGKRIMIHRRSKKGTTEGTQHRHHIFGGWMNPFLDGESMENCASREYWEEANERCKVSEAPVLLMREQIGERLYFSVTFLGATVSRLKRHRSREGEAIPVDIDELPRLFAAEEWVESGLQALLVWLRLGCPVDGKAGVVPEEQAADLLAQCLEATGLR